MLSWQEDHRWRKSSSYLFPFQMTAAEKVPKTTQMTWEMFYDYFPEQQMNMNTVDILQTNFEQHKEGEVYFPPLTVEYERLPER